MSAAAPNLVGAFRIAGLGPAVIAGLLLGLLDPAVDRMIRGLV